MVLSKSGMLSEIDKGIELMKAVGKEPADWIHEMLASGITSFYTIKNGATYYYDIPQKKHIKVPGQDAIYYP